MDKADHINLSVRMGNFSWPDEQVLRGFGPCRQYGWLIVSTYQYIWVIFHVLMGPVQTVHGLLSLILPFSTDKDYHISISVRMGRFFMDWFTKSKQSLSLPGSMDGWSYKPISTYGSFFMYWWDQSGQSMVSWVKSFHSVRIRLIISGYQYVWVDFSWPDGPVWTVLGTSRQYGWMILSAYQYVWVIFHVLMGPVWTVHCMLS